jgi:hypothetical protein
MSPIHNVDSDTHQPPPAGTAPNLVTDETQSTDSESQQPSVTEPGLNHVYVNQPEINTKTWDSASGKASSVTTLVPSPVSLTQSMATHMNKRVIDEGIISANSTNELSHANVYFNKATKNSEVSVAEISLPEVCNN